MHVYPRAAAAAIHVYPRASAATAAARSHVKAVHKRKSIKNVFFLFGSMHVKMHKFYSFKP
jgi:uncharacterized protein YbaP (TraB family)